MKLVRIILASLAVLFMTVAPASAKTSYSLFFSTGPMITGNFGGFGYGAPMYSDIFSPLPSFGYGYQGMNAFNYGGFSAPLTPQYTPMYPFQTYGNVPLSPTFANGYPFNSFGYNGYNNFNNNLGGFTGYNNNPFPNTYNGYANYDGSNYGGWGGLNNNWLNGYNTNFSSQCSVYVSCSCSCNR